MAKTKIEKEIGIIGYKTNLSGHSGGITPDVEPMSLLSGTDKYKWLKEMVLNDPFIGANFKLITTLASKCQYSIEPQSQSKKDIKLSALLSEILFDDPEESFQETVKFIAGSLFAYGFGLSEIVYKKRNDGYFGIKKLANRLSPTIDGWKKNKDNILGVYQTDPENLNKYYIPYDRLLHCKISGILGSPEGTPLTRNCFTSYYSKKFIEADERIKVRKDSRGMPIVKIPNAYLSSDQQNCIDAVDSIKKMLANISAGTDSYCLMPSDNGFEFENTPIQGQLTQDTDKLVQRYDHYIAIALLSDFLLLGQKSGSAGGLAYAKLKIYSSFISSIMDIIKDAVNKKLIPQIIEINKLKYDKMPKLKHTNLSELKNIEAALFIQSAGATKLFTPSVERDNFLGKEFVSEACPEVTEDQWEKYQLNNDNQLDTSSNTNNLDNSEEDIENNE